MGYLPQDMVIDILSRLPVEPLLRFKCVSKSWCALLESEEFISRHIVNQPVEHITLLYSYGNNIMSLFVSDSNYDEDDEHASCLRDFNHLDLKCAYPERDHWSLDLNGHCDGLVVLADGGGEIIICNPSIRELRYLPKSTTFHQYISANSLYAQRGGIGLGYDYKHKEYKVVRIMSFWTDETFSIQLPSRVEVFFLGGGVDSSWRELTNTALEGKFYFNRDMDNYFDGVYYWHAHDIVLKDYLYCFNMTDEVFQKVSVPDGYDGLEWESKLGILNKKTMALFYLPLRAQWKGVHVWVMKELGVKESWTRQLIIGPFMELKQPLAFWKNKFGVEELVGVDETSDLVTYDLSTLERKKFPNHHKQRPCSWEASSYKKTLLSINGNRRRNTIDSVCCTISRHMCHVRVSDS